MILFLIIVAIFLPPKIAIMMLGQKTVLRLGKAAGGIKTVTIPI